MAPVVHIIGLSMEVQHVIYSNLLPCAETFAYLWPMCAQLHSKLFIIVGTKYSLLKTVVLELFLAICILVVVVDRFTSIGNQSHNALCLLTVYTPTI